MSLLKSEKFDGIIEVIIAIILGLGAVLGAFSSFQGSLYGSKMDQSYNEALQSYIDAGSTVTNANGEMISDSIAFAELKKAAIGKQYDTDNAAYYEQIEQDVLPYITSQDLYDAMTWAEEQNAADPDGPSDDNIPYSFYDHPNYGKATIEGYGAAVDAAAAKFEEGNKFNTLGDYHEQYTSIFAIALFLSGLSAVLKKRGVRLTLNVISMVILVSTSIFMFQIPLVMP